MSGILVLLLGTYILFNKGAGTIRVVFFIFSLSIFVWLALFSVGYSMQDPKWAFFWFRLAYVGVVFIPVTSFHFHLEFLKRRPVPLLVLFYSMSFIFLILSRSSLFLQEVKHYFWGFYPRASIIYPFFVIFFMCLVWAGPWLCIRETFVKKRSDSTFSIVQLKRLRLVVIAFFIGNFGSADFLAKFGIPCYPFGYANMVIWFAVLAFAVSQYHLMDIEMAAEMVQTAKLAALGMLSAGINHEIRNPLYVIRGQAQTFLENVKEGIYRNDSEAVSDALRMMRKTDEQADRAADIIRRLAEFARPQKSVNTNKPVNIGECLDYILELIQFEIDLDKIAVKKKVSSDVPFIRADRRHIEEILFNLLLNACQSMSVSGGVVTITVWRKGSSVQVIVEDTGPGFSKEKMQHLFDPFVTTKVSGTGLGLYITKQLIEKNGGKIKIENQEDVGARVCLEFSVFHGDQFVKEEEDKIEVAYSR